MPKIKLEVSGLQLSREDHIGSRLYDNQKVLNIFLFATKGYVVVLIEITSVR